MFVVGSGFISSSSSPRTLIEDYNVYNAVIETFSFGIHSAMVGSWNLGYGLANALMFIAIYVTLAGQICLENKNVDI